MRLANCGLVVTSLMMVCGCFYETQQDARDSGKVKKTPGLYLDNNGTHRNRVIGSCRVDEQSGCFAGQVASAPDVTVEGQSFFDANVLRERFDELIDVKSFNTENRVLTDVSIEVLSEFDNRTFARDFVVYVKGDRAMNAKVRSQGWFALDFMPEGSYDVRVARPFDFRVTATAVTQVEGPNGMQPTTAAVDKAYCAILYSDSAVEVILGESSTQVFDSYELYLDDKECDSTTASRTVSL